MITILAVILLLTLPLWVVILGVFVYMASFLLCIIMLFLGLGLLFTGEIFMGIILIIYGTFGLGSAYSSYIGGKGNV